MNKPSLMTYFNFQTLYLIRFFYFTVLVFFIVFQFKVPYLLNSSYFTLILTLPLFNNRSLRIFISLLLSKKFLFLLILYLLPFIYTLLSTLILGMNDFTLHKFMITGPIFILCSMAFISVFYSRGGDLKTFIKILFIVILIQAVISIFSFINSDFFEFIKQFQFDSSLEKSSLYSGTRGFTLSGGLFFSVAITLSFLFLVISIYEFNAKNRWYIYITLLLLTLVFLPVGRTVMIWILMFFIYLFFNLNKLGKTVKVILSVVLFFVSSVYFLLFLSNDLVQKVVPLIERGFEFIINYYYYGSLSTDSTDVLEGMYFVPSIWTIFFGDGAYTGYDGLYYMHTDAGYMRNILLFGFPATLLFFVFDFLIISRIARMLSDNLVEKYKIISFLYIFILILHYKGEVLGYSFPFHSVLFMFYFLSILINQPYKHLTSRN